MNPSNDLMQDELDEMIEDYEESNECNPYSPNKLVGVAVAGAVGSLMLYFVYNQLDAERKEQLRNMALSSVKSKLEFLPWDSIGV